MVFSGAPVRPHENCIPTDKLELYHFFTRYIAHSGVCFVQTEILGKLHAEACPVSTGTPESS